MSRKMLIDAAHPEETRVVVLDGTRVEEFDFESQNKKQLRGNIYLAKVIRVEPSLQAAFVEYGGNRHGFLAFNEIHPDYFQIPLADREALMREAEEDDDDHHAPSQALDEEGEAVAGMEDEDEVDEEVQRRRRRLMRRYKIQEVIKRRQIMLVQVVKEERGNKGAALTTYLSLAGRYCVLMPNTDRGGGISRKIDAATDRKRLRAVVQSLAVPKGMGLIVRTAGAKRTKTEIKRDYDYLDRAWENIRETTLHSIAPALIYEEEGLVKRAIRDLYDKDLDGIWVEGEAGFREAREIMRMLMPGEAKKVQPYREAAPLFVRYGIENHLSQIYSPVVPLRSGGYLVINQTEALVAVDVNSGRATRERNIEATALKTNMEAAEETCRQLRLRDLAGLIVIDFIDMDEGKNNRAVEKVLKDCLKEDRARVQMGKISGFGLMEISRQRRRTGILEGTTHVCPHCQGAGRVRSVESSALAALRAVEMEAIKGGGEISLRVPKDVGLYILNAKRDHLVRVRQATGLQVNVVLDETLSHAEHEIDRLSSHPHEARAVEAPAPAPYDDAEDLDAYEAEVEEEEEEEEILDEAEEDEEDNEGARPVVAREASSGDDEDSDDSHRRGGRRRRRRGRRGDEPRAAVAAAAPVSEAPAREREEPGAFETDAEGHRRRRRGRRGGRRMREETRAGDVYAWSWPSRPIGDDPYQWRGPVPAQVAEAPQRPVAEAPPPSPLAALEPPVPLDPTTANVPAGMEIIEPEAWVELPVAEEAPKRSRRARGRRKASDEVDETPAVDVVSEAPAPVAAEPEPVESAQPVVAEAAPEPTPEPVVEAPEVEVAVAANFEPEPEATPEPAPETTPEPALALVAEAPLAPPAPAEPDPAEIQAPPAAPKRGWWRGRA